VRGNYHGHLLAAAGPLLPPVRVRTPAGDALPLTPLLSVQLCAVCGQWTAFYLDKYDKDKHRAQFLDFVEGHSNDYKDLEPLRTRHVVFVSPACDWRDLGRGRRV